MQRIGSHPATAILRSLADIVRITALDREKPTLIVEDIRSTPWASITFTGLRHEFDLRLEGETESVALAILGFGADLGDLEVPMAGHFLAEIAVVSTGPAEIVTDMAPGHCARRLRIEALTVRD